MASRQVLQKGVAHAVEQLEHYFELSIMAEDTQQDAATVVYYRECQRWGLIASLLLNAGVNSSEYADN